MCGRFGISPKDVDDAYDRFYADRSKQLELVARYNVSPSQEVPIVVRNSPNHFELMHWGYQPEWMKKKGMSKAIINARDDKLSSFTYKKAFQFQRCIIPASHFFEWKAVDGEKVPYLFKVKSMELFGFAGLYFEKKEGRVFVIITTSPNEIMSDVHNRMPVILSEDEEDIWLNPDNVEIEQLMSMVDSYPSEDMTRFVVSREVNNPRNESPDIIKPYEA